jgi:RHS repeat-associated protein
LKYTTLYHPFSIAKTSLLLYYLHKNVEYIFGFNGQENDNEVKGDGGQQDYGMRIYDTRLGRFLSVDPLSSTYPWYSPYQFAGNLPIAAVDLDGEEELIIIRWYDHGKYVGESVFRIENLDDRVKRNGALYVNLDIKAKEQIHSKFSSKGKEWKSIFFNKSESGKFSFKKDFGIYSATFRNRIDKNRRDKLKMKNEKGDKNAILWGSFNIPIYFNEGSAKYDKKVEADGESRDNDKSIGIIAKFLKDNPDYSATIFGSANTNGEGSFDNKKLSDKRATTAKNELISTGIDNSKILDNGGFGATDNLKGKTENGTKELNKNATIYFFVPQKR